MTPDGELIRGARPTIDLATINPESFASTPHIGRSIS
jgi:hypothetical protein